jgi:hypothetical protein
VWCKACRHQVEPDPAELTERYGAGVSVLDWRDRLICSRCGGRDNDEVTISPIGILKRPIARIRPAENRHLNAAVIVFPFGTTQGLLWKFWAPRATISSLTL